VKTVPLGDFQRGGAKALVLDTDILGSAALKPESPLASIVERVLLRQAPLHVCASVVAEYLTR
jgi:hypothetical protein